MDSADEIHCERDLQVVDYVQQMMSGRKVGEAAVVLPKKAVKWGLLQLPVFAKRRLLQDPLK